MSKEKRVSPDTWVVVSRYNAFRASASGSGNRRYTVELPFVTIKPYVDVENPFALKPKPLNPTRYAKGISCTLCLAKERTPKANLVLGDSEIATPLSLEFIADVERRGSERVGPVRLLGELYALYALSYHDPDLTDYVKYDVLPGETRLSEEQKGVYEKYNNIYSYLQRNHKPLLKRFSKGVKNYQRFEQESRNNGFVLDSIENTSVVKLYPGIQTNSPFNKPPERRDTYETLLNEVYENDEETKSQARQSLQLDRVTSYDVPVYGKSSEKAKNALIAHLFTTSDREQHGGLPTDPKHEIWDFKSKVHEDYPFYATQLVMEWISKMTQVVTKRKPDTYLQPFLKLMDLESGSLYDLSYVNIPLPLQKYDEPSFMKLSQMVTEEILFVASQAFFWLDAALKKGYISSDHKPEHTHAPNVPAPIIKEEKVTKNSGTTIKVGNNYYTAEECYQFALKADTYLRGYFKLNRYGEVSQNLILDQTSSLLKITKPYRIKHMGRLETFDNTAFAAMSVMIDIDPAVAVQGKAHPDKRKGTHKASKVQIKTDDLGNTQIIALNEQGKGHYLLPFDEFISEF